MFRYTEKELRDFLVTHADIWRVEELDEIDNQSPIEAAYARGAYEAYVFVLRFMNEYKLEEEGENNGYDYSTND